MSKPRTILTIVGARPQFIKAAPVSRALAKAGLREILLHTGQHFDAAMSDVFFDELDIPKPIHHFAIHSVGHGAMTGRMLEQIEQVLLSEKPDMVLIYGDTNSTLAGALAAAKLRIPVAHVEAGLRSFNRAMPEEINRILADQVSDLLFCPTGTAVENLARENINRGVHQVGDVMFDTTLQATEKARTQSSVINELELTPKTYAVCTVHRAENTDDSKRFAKIFAWLGSQAMPIVMPVHPRTRKLLDGGVKLPVNIRPIAPLGYLDMTWLLHNASAAYTDSGGLQKEAYFHRVPCVTLRNETEWVETIECGWNRLWTSEGYKPQRNIVDYGDGNASEKIARVMADYISTCPSAAA